MGPYRVILSSNVALETLNKISPSPENNQAYNLAKGSALFTRAFRHFSLMNNYCLQYDKATSQLDLGIPYKTSSDITEKTIRLSLQQSYDYVLSDLKEAIRLLPLNTTVATRPTKQAAYGLLARVYLTMNDYANSLLYADSCLSIYNNLMDYNSVNPIGNGTPFKRFNVEDMYHCTGSAGSILQYSNCNIDSILYNSYDSNDLRKTCFFVKNPKGYYSFRGWYDENLNQGPFAGIATDELFLIRSECYARAGNTTAALADLNTLLKNRFKKNKFTDITAPDAPSALNIILNERRKELVMRNNIRWTDLKRLNKDPKYAKTLIRIIHNTQYSLPPNDKRYALLIPPTEITLSGMPQNSR